MSYVFKKYALLNFFFADFPILVSELLNNYLVFVALFSCFIIYVSTANSFENAQRLFHPSVEKVIMRVKGQNSG